MSRTGPEAKPQWQAVPAEVKAEVERRLGAAVARAERVYGGYAPSATFRMRLADGRRVFLKGVNESSNDFMRRGLALEERIYRELAPLIRPWAPEFFDSLTRDDWHVVLLEDVGPADVPPWTLGRVRQAMRDYAEFHRASVGRTLPNWLPDHITLIAGFWDRFRAQDGALEAVASLAGTATEEARRWLEAYVPALRDAAARLPSAGEPRALLHLDTRSDNVRTAPRLRLFDWNWATVGAPEADLAHFAQAIAAEDGPAPELSVRAYVDVAPIRENLVAATIAGLAGAFASSSARPPDPALPRVRSLQRRQLKVCLAWAARLLRLPEPRWVGAIPS